MDFPCLHDVYVFRLQGQSDDRHAGIFNSSVGEREGERERESTRDTEQERERSIERERAQNRA